MADSDYSDDAADTVKSFKKQLAHLEYELKISNSLLEISNAVDSTHNLDDLYASIHRALDRIIDVRNIYISIYDEKDNILHFPYVIDEADGTHSDSFRIFDEKSLTGEVITQKAPLFLNADELRKREQENAIVGTAPKIFMGVPLISGGKVIGMLAIQNYHDENAYSKDDLQILISISKQIAIAIERKKKNDALKESEERYRTISEKSHDIIMRFDRSFRHLYVNSAIKKLGFTPEEMIGRTHEELGFPENLVQLWEEAIAQVFETQQVHRIEFQLPESIWVDWLLCPEFSTDARMNSVLTFARDITERKQIDFYNSCYDRINQIIINSSDVRQMLNGILDAMLDIFYCDRSWILFPCNPDADYYEVPFLQCRQEWYVPPGDRFEIAPEYEKMIQDVRNSDNPVIFDSVTRRKVRQDVQELRQVKSQIVMAVFPKSGDAWEVGLHQCSYDRVWKEEESVLFKGICRRITDGLDNMLLLRELKQAKNYIDNVVDSMPSVLIGVDGNGRITQWNSRAFQETGVSFEKAAGKSYVEFFPHLVDFQTAIEKGIHEHEIVEKHKIQYLRNGKTCFENITVYPLTNIDLKGAVIRMDDVTEQIRMEEMMVQSEKMLSVGGLAAGMAHEINNPLAGMMQNAQVLENRLTKDIPANHKAAQKAGTNMEAIRAFMENRKIIQQLGHINKAGKRAAKVVENMLSFAKKAGGSKQYEDIAALLKRTIELAQNDYDLKKRFDFKQIRINTSKPDNFPMVLCEGSKIQQVFLNIVKNAAEAICDEIKSMKEDPQFDIEYSSSQTHVQIRIKDNGPGMEKEVAKRIFEPFYTTKAPNKGTGLGLSVAFFIIVEDHDGELAVESEPGKGATFIIKLPIHG